MPSEKNDPIAIVRDEFHRRLTKNKHYSLRAYAKQLKISPGRLSELLSRKRRLTSKQAAKIADALMLRPQARNSFIGLTEAKTKNSKSRQEPVYLQIEEDTFDVVSDWFHFAILSLMETEDAQTSPTWIARKLGISVIEAQSAIERLLRLGLLKTEGQSLKVTHKNLATTSGLPSAALRRSHKQSLSHVAQVLDSVEQEFRDITSITMAIDVGKIPQAKNEIRVFRRKLAKLLESGKRTAVYDLNIQLIPVERKR